MNPKILNVILSSLNADREHLELKLETELNSGKSDVEEIKRLLSELNSIMQSIMLWKSYFPDNNTNPPQEGSN